MGITGGSGRLWASLMALVLGVLALSGCHRNGNEGRLYRIDSTQVAQGQDDRIQFLVIHYTAGDFTSALTTLTDRQVSAHYLIPLSSEQNTPRVLRLVEESRRAWHAGPSSWRGYTHLNDTSIGIELENRGYWRDAAGLHWANWQPQQVATLIALSQDIIRRYHILPQNVIGHSDIAWQRKQDPGPRFPWQQLAAAGVGVWPAPARVTHFLAGRQPNAPVAMSGIIERMARYGYAVSTGMPPARQRQAVAAFQMHFRPRDYQGSPDVQTEAILDALLEIDAGNRGSR